ncbi:DMT family transporter [Aurantibacter aestuarii]|uniref:Permease n=1 Tax=Aurantibacter aestuarii TaxID=1266046 RepID=A0A2T1NC97_9FLAO|nr:EamA family transporter [Aurantibacter aestuarii]PSG90061.1 permease [Aurantibacter aestuarii]
MTNDTKKWLFLVILSLIWGTSFILIKKSLIGLTPYQLGALRTIVTGFILFCFGFKSLKHIETKHWKWIGLSGLLGSFFPSFLFSIAETEIDSAVASILNSLVPLNTILVGLALFKITTNLRQIIGVIIGFLGTAFLILEGADLNPKQNYLFAGYVIIATLMYATNVNIIKKYLQDVKALSIATGNYVCIYIPALIVLLFTNFFSEETFTHPKFNESIFYVVFLSLFGTAIAKVLFNRLVQISTPIFASSVTYIMPIVALLWGLGDGESFSLTQGIATCVILFGVYIANRKPKKVIS